MHDLRAAVYRHLQRLSLAFFTQTRTGEIQSRIANDIGGVQTRRHEHRDLDRLERDDRAGRDGRDVPARLAPRGGGARPAAVLRMAHPPRRRGAAADHRRAPGPARRHLGAGRGVAVGLGHPARQDDGPRAASWRSASSASRPSSPTSRSARAWRGAGGWRRCRSSFAAMPALIYLFAGLTIANGGGAITIGTLVAFTTLQTRLFFPVQSLLSVGVDVQSSLALFERVFDYLDLPGRDRGARRCGDAATRARARSGRLRGRRLPLRGRTGHGRCATSTSRSRPGRRSRSSARPARERRRSPTCWRASTTSRRDA